MSKPKRHPLWLAVVLNVVMLRPFRLVMYGPDGDWIAWTGTKDSFAQALYIWRHYRRMGFR